MPELSPKLGVLNRHHSLAARLRYAFDNYMSKGTVALIGGLFALSVLIIVAISLVVTISGTLTDNPETQGLDLLQVMWRSLLRTLDPGTMGADVGSVPFLLAMLAVTLGGIFIISTLIGVISTGIEGKLADLRKGRSQALESNHTVILGWSAQIFDIVSEIIEANANQRGRSIVVLADRDKVEMEDALRARIPDTRTTRVVCRSGSPIDLGDLAITSLSAARAIVVLAPETEEPDADVIKTLLAISNDPARRSTPYRLVAEIRDEHNLEVARLASRGEAQLVLGRDLIGRIAAQTCRQPGLSVVYTDLLDFAGDEIYFYADPVLVGRTFGDTLLEFRDSCLIGIIPVDGRPMLNPPMERVIAEGDRLIFVAEDDDTIVRTERPAGTPRLEQIVRREHATARPECVLVLGWNQRTAFVLAELDRYVTPGSMLTVVADGADYAEQAAAVAGRLNRLTMKYRAGDTTDRPLLDEVIAEEYDHVVVMSYSDLLDEQRADARTLVTLLHLRDIEAHQGESFTIVSEMLDVRNRALAQVTRADDFIVSGKLVSLMMSQLAENPELRGVFDDLFDEVGSEVYLKPAADYVRLGEPVDFYTVVESARRRGEVAFGYRLLALAEDPEQAYGVVINPLKERAVTFAELDRIIVLAED
jgi:voltage-gated potassium channel Kch